MKKNKAEFGNDLTAHKGPAAVVSHNKKFYEDATPKQRSLMDEVQNHLDLANKDMEELFFGEAFEQNGKTYYTASDTTKEVLRIIKETGIKKEELQVKINNLSKGAMMQLAGTWYIKRFDDKIQEVTAYVFTIENLLASTRREYAELKTLTSPTALKSEASARLGFWGHIKAAFSCLRGAT